MRLSRLTHYLISFFFLSLAVYVSAADSIPEGFRKPLSWKVGAEMNPSWIPGTNSFLRGVNDESRRIKVGLSGNLRTDFSFAPVTKEGLLYHGLYQGVGVGVNSFFCNSLLGTPVSAYVYQGAPIFHLADHLWLGYEWRFGVAFGWKHHDEEITDNNSAVSTSVTAMLGLGAKLHYALSDRLELTFGVDATHYSNGNTSWPNAGVNAIGATVGISYTINPQTHQVDAPSWLIADADKGRWLWDIMAYGAWRKRGVNVGNESRICPGKFGIVGLQVSPLRKLNRYVAVVRLLKCNGTKGLE